MIFENRIIKVNRSVVFRDNFDDIVVLFNPDTGKSYSLNHTDVLIWKSPVSQGPPLEL